MATTEDFTFPTFTTFSFSIDSPPLWRLSPSASPNSSHKREPTRGIGSHNLSINYKCVSPPSRSFSLVRREDHVNKEDKMDMLWEDFNEELFKRSYNGNDSSSSRLDSGRVNIGCVQGFRLSKSNVTTVFNPRSNKLSGLEVFIKILKKFLLRSNSRKSVNRQPRFSWSN